MRLKKNFYKARFPFSLKYLKIYQNHKTIKTEIIFPKELIEDFIFHTINIPKSVRFKLAYKGKFYELKCYPELQREGLNSVSKY